LGEILEIEGKKMNQRELRRTVEERLAESVEGRRIFQRKPWTFVLLQVRVNGILEEIFDFAKVQYPDEWDPKRGRELAEQKAIAALAKKLVNEHGDPRTWFFEGDLPRYHGRM